MLGANVRQRGDVRFGDHQKMNRRPRVDVMEDKNFVILVDQFGRDFPRHNFAKQAIGVSVTQMTVGLRGQTEAHGLSASRAKTLRKAFSSIPLVPKRRSNSVTTSAGVSP